MNKEDIRIDDWHRILIGEAPNDFMWEVLFRSIIIYFLMLVVVRLLGKRMSGQLTLTEMSVMLTMGAIISPSLQAPDRGILLGVLAMICTLSFQRGTTWLAFRNKGFEHATQSETTMLVKDGVLQLGNLADTRVSRQQIFAQLRGQSIYKLSQVKRLYLEAQGDFSLYEAEAETPGLSTLPPDDADIHTIQPCADQTMACISCGNTVKADQQQVPCPVCKKQDWTTAVA